MALGLFFHYHNVQSTVLSAVLWTFSSSFLSSSLAGSLELIAWNFQEE
jgi:hypothetical protein